MEEWIKLGTLDEAETDFSKYKDKVGVYKVILNNDVVYIGKATESKNRGFRKRLRDYTRESDSARNYPAGKKMYDNKSILEIEILPMDASDSGKLKIAALEKQLIRELKPSWNVIKK